MCIPNNLLNLSETYQFLTKSLKFWNANLNTAYPKFLTTKNVKGKAG